MKHEKFSTFARGRIDELAMLDFEKVYA